MTAEHRAEACALLTRAADLEARRQSALKKGDDAVVVAIENELRELWRRHADLERAA